MQNRQLFGGAWTEDKLNRLNKYLRAYLSIFKNNVKAQFYTTTYVDAFAGTGYVVTQATGSIHLFSELAEPEAQEFLKGSARRALDLQPGFDKYLFIERKRANYQELQRLCGSDVYRNIAGRISIKQGDANRLLTTWCAATDWSTNRAVLFLDPFGMEVEWATLETIAATGGIDMWLLFPFVGVSRHLTKSEPPPPSWADRLTKILGNDEWLQEFYPAKTELTLFGEVEQQAKDADFDRISAYVVRRLKTLFPGVAENPLPLRNSRNTPLFLLCFATCSRKDSIKKTALKIAQDILKR